MVVGASAAHATTLSLGSTADCSTPEVTITADAAAGACQIGGSPAGAALVKSGLNDTFWTASFTGTVTGVSIDLGDHNADADRLFLSAFDSGNNNIETVTLDILSSSRIMHTLSLVSTGIAKITFGTTGEIGRGGIYAQNLNFTPETSPVPIPAAGFLLMGGLGGLAALRRRRKS
ncbi:MAG: VPLPA-CTERM sorting domain-containing protein [Marinibacterium sp.]